MCGRRSPAVLRSGGASGHRIFPATRPSTLPRARAVPLEHIGLVGLNSTLRDMLSVEVSDWLAPTVPRTTARAARERGAGDVLLHVLGLVPPLGARSRHSPSPPRIGLRYHSHVQEGRGLDVARAAPALRPNRQGRPEPGVKSGPRGHSINVRYALSTFVKFH